jgi:hypothetical protein
LASSSDRFELTLVVRYVPALARDFPTLPLSIQLDDDSQSTKEPDLVIRGFLDGPTQKMLGYTPSIRRLLDTLEGVLDISNFGRGYAWLVKSVDELETCELDIGKGPQLEAAVGRWVKTHLLNLGKRGR